MPPPDDDRLERALATAWPARVVRPVGPWWLRAADGFTKRANSAAVLGRVSAGQVPGLLEEVRRFAERHSIPPRVQVASTDRTAAVRDRLPGAGWHVESGNDVLTAELKAESGQAAPPGGVEVADHPDERWLATWSQALHGRSDVIEPARALFARMPSPAAFLSVVRTGSTRPDAVGVGVVVDGVLGVFGVAVRAAARGRGRGRRVVQAAHAWGRDHGAGESAVQVVATNRAAVRLYRRAGYHPSHSTEFWRGDLPPG